VVPSGPWPAKRSFHTACALVDPNTIPCHHLHQHTPPAEPPTASGVHPKQVHPSWLPSSSPPDLCGAGEDEEKGVGRGAVVVDPKLVVLWGMDNEGDPVPDCWVLNVTTLMWEKVR